MASMLASSGLTNFMETYIPALYGYYNYYHNIKASMNNSIIRSCCYSNAYNCVPYINIAYYESDTYTIEI